MPKEKQRRKQETPAKLDELPLHGWIDQEPGTFLRDDA
jgi:hypothetical protein